MSDGIIIAIALAVPVVLLTVLRINAVLVFLSICLGEVLVHFIGSEANGMLSLFSEHSGKSMTYSSLMLVFLLGPAVITSLFMLFSIHGHMKTMLNILPAIGSAVVGFLLAVPLFTPGLRYAIERQTYWKQLVRAEVFIVGASAIVSLVFLWTQRHKKHEGKKHHR